MTAREKTIWNRRPAKGVIHHSDQGRQYTSIAFGSRCQPAGIVPSMGAAGDCYDNTIIEAFFATLDCERSHQHRFRTHAEARTALFAYIEGFYNPHRWHSALGYHSQAAYERDVVLEPVVCTQPAPHSSEQRRYSLSQALNCPRERVNPTSVCKRRWSDSIG